MRGFYLDLPEVVEAMNILYGTGKAPSSPAGARLDLLSVKSAFRRRAFETHPDRAVLTGEPVRELEGRFRELAAAYETVMRYVSQGGQLSFALSGAPWQGTGGTGAFGGLDAGLSPDALYTGDVPSRRLLLGQYLYYTRVISRAVLASALVWQKMKRPLIGQIAMKWKWLVREDISSILAGRVSREKFCFAAERMGYLAPYQTLILLGRQRVLQPRLGQYFIEKGILDAPGVAELARGLRSHNRKFGR
jgi:hypothetical protein